MKLGCYFLAVSFLLVVGSFLVLVEVEIWCGLVGGYLVFHPKLCL